MRFLTLAFTLGVLFAGFSPANAQQQVRICVFSSPQAQCVPVSASNPFPVSASVSASITGYRPVSSGTPISVTTGGNTGTLPTNTGEVVATNVGTTNGAYCALGASATTAAQYIAPNGGWFAFGISGDTQLTCITSTSTTTVNMTGGSGLPTGTGGGGGGGGSSGAVFGPTAVGSAAANPPVLVGGTADGTATGNVSVLQVISGVGQVSSAPPVNVTPTTCGGTITTGGTAQNAFGASGTKHGFFLMNLSTDPLWWSVTTTASIGGTQSFLLSPGTSTVAGGTFVSPPGFGVNTALSVIAATTADAWSCTYY